MAAQKTQAGTITRETMIPIQRIPVAGEETITKGDVCTIGAKDYLQIGTSLITTDHPFYVALETVDTTGIADGLIDCACAVPGHYVTVVMDISDGTGGIGKHVTNGVANGAVRFRNISGLGGTQEVVGTFISVEGGIVSKDGSTPFGETLEDKEVFGTSAQRLPVSGDIVEIRLGRF